MPRIWSKGAVSSGGGGEEYKAGEGLEESGSKPVTFKIKELVNYIVKAGEQTITGLKTFSGGLVASKPEGPTEEEEPPPIGVTALITGGEGGNATGPGTRGGAGGAALEVTGGKGGQNTNVEEGIGGVGGRVQISSGPGGKATAATGAGGAVGGAGGELQLITGAGAEQAVASAKENRGGSGGSINITAANGGQAAGSGTVTSRFGGVGGEVTLKAGSGGAATGTGTTKTAGLGGAFSFSAGAGGAASGTGTNIGGEGGAFVMNAGAAGTGGTPKGGSFTMKAGAASTAALSGPIIFKTGTGIGTERVTINGEGLTTVKAGLTVEGTLTLPAESVKASALKIGTPEATKELKAGTKIKGIAGASTMVYMSVIFEAKATEGEVIADGKTIFKILKETLATSSKVMHFSFKMKAGAECELKLTEGALEGATSVYVLQEC